MTDFLACPSCGATATADQAFCARCGLALAGARSGGDARASDATRGVGFSLRRSLERLFERAFRWSGRAPANEYWWAQVSAFCVTFIVGFLAGFAHVLGFGALAGPLALVNMLVGLCFLVAMLAVGARRLHDTGRSAWWLLLGLVPVLGILGLWAIYALPSQPHANKWGPPDPL